VAERKPMRNPAWHIAVLLALLLLSASQRLGAQDIPERFKVGMSYRTFHPQEPYNWRGAQTHALGAVVWYPVRPTATEQPLVIPGMSNIFVLGSVVQDARIATASAKFPLIMLSHGTGGSALSMAWIGEALAARGYIVTGVNHPGNNATEAYTAQGFSTWWERAKDLSVGIDAMLADATFGSHIDARSIGATGFSLGGYTMIEIAGGISEPAAFRQFCTSPQADNICKSPPEFPTLLEDFDRLSKTDPEFQAALKHAADSYRDPRVRAVFAMAPALGPAFPRAGLAKISIPVEIVAGAADTNVPVQSSAKYFAANIPGATFTIFPGNVGHYTFLDSCPDSARKTRALFCSDGPGVDRDAVHEKTAQLAAAFFTAALK